MSETTESTARVFDDAVVEAAKRAWSETPEGGDFDTWSTRSMCAALSAAADALEAQVLNDVATEVEIECSGSSDPCYCTSAAWLRRRATLHDPR